MTIAASSVQNASDSRLHGRGELALSLQEAFTVVARLRTGRQGASDTVSFRQHIKQLLSTADQRARTHGYDAQSVKLAIYAYVALLDESVLASGQSMFSDWSRQPLQEEVFGDHMAGENFFRTADELLGRQDSDELADVLEVYQLCMLLGFKGRYGGDPGRLHSVMSAIQSKIERIRGGQPLELVPEWKPPANEKVDPGRDPWARRLTIFAGAAFLLALVLYVIYRLMIGSAASGLSEIAMR